MGLRRETSCLEERGSRITWRETFRSKIENRHIWRRRQDLNPGHIGGRRVLIIPVSRIACMGTYFAESLRTQKCRVGEGVWYLIAPVDNSRDWSDLCLNLKKGLTANSPNPYSFFFSQQYGSPPSKEEIVEAGNSCPICQEDLKDPIKLRACKVRRWWRFPQNWLLVLCFFCRFRVTSISYVYEPLA